MIGTILEARATERASIHGRKRRLTATAVLAAGLGLGACHHSDTDDEDPLKINGTVHVAAGKHNESVATVNGAIHIDDNASFTTAAAVNGDVRMGAGATGGSLSTVNGAVTVDKSARLSGNLNSVNGEVTIKDGAEVLGTVANVNGQIDLTNAHVGGGIKTANGNISINGTSRVEGGIVVQKPTIGLSTSDDTRPRIVIGPGATVQGALRFERPVLLYVSDQATIGPVNGATPITFSGPTPPPP